jgi:hypothetical protein
MERDEQPSRTESMNQESSCSSEEQQNEKVVRNHEENGGDLLARNSPDSHDRKQKRAKKWTFPFKLHRMLRDSKKENTEHIVSWSPDGESFKIYNQELFVSEVMPKYFKQTKYRSFQRMVGTISIE